MVAMREVKVTGLLQGPRFYPGGEGPPFILVLDSELRVDDETLYEIGVKSHQVDLEEYLGKWIEAGGVLTTDWGIETAKHWIIEVRTAKKINEPLREKALVEVKKVMVIRVKNNLFSVFADGTVPTPGWVVNLRPAIYILRPENLLIQAVGIEPTGVIPQPMTRWDASVEIRLSTETKRVSVEGSNQTITKEVPW